MHRHSFPFCIPASPIPLFLALLAIVMVALPGPAAATDKAPNQFLDCSAGSAPNLGFARAPSKSTLRLYGAMTVEAWVRASVSQPYSPFPVIVGKPVADRINGNANFVLLFEAANGHLHFRVTTQTMTRDAIWTGNLMDGQWHHVAGVRKGFGLDSLLLYLDGNPVAGTPIGGVDSTSTDSVSFGALTFPGYEGNHLKGQIDEVRIWNVARTSLQISGERYLIRNRGWGLVGAWHFDHFYNNFSGFFGQNFYLMDSSYDPSGGRADATAYEGAALGVSDLTPMNRGYNFEVVDRQGVDGDTDPYWANVVMQLNGEPALGHRNLSFLSTSASWNFCAVQASPPTTAFVDSCTSVWSGSPARIPAFGPTASRSDGTIFVFQSVDGISYIVPYIGTTTKSPIPAQDTLSVPPATALLVDPFNTNLVISLGLQSSGGALHSYLDVISAPPGQSMSRVLEADLGGTPTIGIAHDLAIYGSYFFVTFDDSLRIYHYFTVVGVPVIGRVPGAIYTGDRAAVGVSGSTLVLAIGQECNCYTDLLTYDISIPTSPVAKGFATMSNSELPDHMQISNNMAVITGPNGVSVFNVANPSAPSQMGYYVADAPAVGQPAVSTMANQFVLSAGSAGYYMLDFIGYPTGVGPPAASAGGTLRLASSPNPFLSTSRLSFVLPARERVRVSIYDVSGRRVARIAEADMEPGTHELTWNGRAQGGAETASGIYVWRLEAGDQVRTLRVARLK